MRTSNPEQESNLPVKEVSIGEWFKPFDRYADIPYSVIRETFRSKEVRFKIGQLGEFTASLFWQKDDYSNIPCLIIIPTNEIRVEEGSMRTWEGQYEARLMTMSVTSQNKRLVDKSIPYKVEVILPSENHLEGNFENDHGEAPHCYYFSPSGDEKQDMLLAEIEEVIEKVQIRVVPLKD